MLEWATKPYVYISIGAIFTIIGGVMSALQGEKFEKDIQGNILGGDSYCFLERFFDESGHLNFALKHVGEYPMYDVNVVIRDVTKRAELLRQIGLDGKEMTSDEWKKLTTEGDLGGKLFEAQSKSRVFNHVWPSLPKGAFVMPIYRIKLPEDKSELRFLGKIYARNVTITQPIRLLKVKGEWKESTRIQKFDNENHKPIEIDSDLSPDVPLSADYGGE